MRSRQNLSEWTEGIDFTGHLGDDVRRFLVHHGCNHTCTHSIDVEEEAISLAQRFGLDTELASQAALLHDISGVIPAAQRAHVAQLWGLDVLPEEEAHPFIVHQKLSALFAAEIFHIEDESVLSAIGCHTTLKANPSALDELVFVADKIRWDVEDTPPYLDAIFSALDISLEAAAYCYLEYMWNRRSELAVLHPWLEAAYIDLGQNLRK